VTIEFALRVASGSKDLVREDYDKLRAHGVTDEELVEIIQVAAIGSSGDVLADALKVEVDDMVAQALGRN
jgi:alkylhydroperoxidase family enzyme